MNERAIFDAAIEIDDPSKRHAFVEKACSGNRLLLERVRTLLAAHELERSDASGGSVSNAAENTTEFSVDVTNLSNWANAVTKDLNEDEDEFDLAFLKPSNSPNSIGSLAHYEILQVLGQGGFGIVFKAFDEKLHRLVAIKVMNPQMAATSPPRKRFLREARSAAGIKHENIVGVYGVEEEPLPYLVMEYINCITLQQKLDDKGPLEPLEVLHLGRQMASGLAAAHESGLIHRDIKPGNVLIEAGAEQKVKITDFGLARSVDDSSMTRTGVISGTPMYMAPEQATGATLDHRTDLFSLGSVLYQMCSGRPPFRAPTTIAVLRRVVEDKPRPIWEVIPETPTWLIAIIDRLLQKNPDDRFQTAKEVADLMGRYQSELQLHGEVRSYIDASNPKPSASESKEEPLKLGPSTNNVRLSNRSVLTAIVASISVIALVGAWLFSNWMNPQLDPSLRSSVNQNNLAEPVEPQKAPVKVLPPIHGETSLVPYPQAITGLKSWGIVRSYPSGPFTGVDRMPDGKIMTACVGSPCFFIHNDDWSVKQVLLPKHVGNEGFIRGGILALAVAPRGGRVAFVNASYMLCVYDLEMGQIVWNYPLTPEVDVYKLAFSQDARKLAFAARGSLNIFSLEPGGEKHAVELSTAQGTSPRSICWSPDDKELWMVGQDKTFYAYSGTDLEALEGHPLASNKLSALALATDLTEAAFVSNAGEVRVLRCADLSVVAAWKLEKVEEVDECKWSPNQKRIAFTGTNRIEVWDRTSKQRLADGEGNGKIAWKTDSDQVTTLFNHKAANTLDIPSGKMLPVRYGPIPQYYFLGCTSANGSVGLGSVEGDVVLFKGSSRQQGWHLHFSEGARESAISHQIDRAVIELGFDSKGSKVVRLQDRMELLSLPGYHPTWSPDDSKIAMLEKPHSAVIYDSQSGKPLQRFEIAEGQRIRTSWSPDGRFLAVRIGWETPMIHLWDTQTENLTTHRDFLSTVSEANCLWLAPTWRSNNSLLVPFGDQVYEITTDPDAKPISKIRGVVSLSIAHDTETDRSLVTHFSGITVCDGNGKVQQHFAVSNCGGIGWLFDHRRFVTEPYHYYEIPARGFDADKRQQLGCCFPCLGRDAWLTIGPTGHYQGSEGIESEIRYIALHDDGRQITYSAEEFAREFQWKNDPRQATFLDLVEVAF